MDIFKVFRGAANTEKAAKMSAYMRDQFAYLGIPTPERRELSKEFLKGVDKKTVDWDFVFKCWEQDEREFQYLAVDYLTKVKKALTAEDIPKLRGLIVSRSWWDTIDALDAFVGDIAFRYPEVRGEMLKWSKDENFWVRRTAIDHQLAWKDKTDVKMFEKILVNNFGQTEFFINKAIGWSLREYSKTDPDWVRGFIAKYGDKMAKLSVKEASKYI